MLRYIGFLFKLFTLPQRKQPLKCCDKNKCSQNLCEILVRENLHVLVNLQDEGQRLY